MCKVWKLKYNLFTIATVIKLIPMHSLQCFYTITIFLSLASLSHLSLHSSYLIQLFLFPLSLKPTPLIFNIINTVHTGTTLTPARSSCIHKLGYSQPPTPPLSHDQQVLSLTTPLLPLLRRYQMMYTCSYHGVWWI